MDELLTTRQLQEFLKVDRITVYRMLYDGRLKGIKVGNQWRFQKEVIERILDETPTIPRAEGSGNIQDFPSDCIIKVQQLFAGLLGIGAVIVSLQGEALHEPHYSNPFCRAMLKNPKTCEKCRNSWKEIADNDNRHAEFLTCHAGLRYLKVPLMIDGKASAWFIAGQYRLEKTIPKDMELYLNVLAGAVKLSAMKMRGVYDSVPVLGDFQRKQVLEWTPKVALTIQTILQERKQVMDRLQQISELSRIERTLAD